MPEKLQIEERNLNHSIFAKVVTFDRGNNSLQLMALGQLHSHMQKNEVEPVPHIIYHS